MSRCFCLMLLVLIHLPAWAAEPAFRFANANWVDPSGQVDVHSIASQAFTEFGLRAAVGHNGHPLWIRVDIVPNVSDANLSNASGPDRRSVVIRISNRTLDRVELNWNIDGRWFRQVSGDRMLRQERGLCSDDMSCFLIEDPPTGAFTAYLKVSNRTAAFFTVGVLALDELPRETAWRLAILSISMTVGFALLCVGLVILLLEYRSHLVIAFCVFQLSVLCFMGAASGLSGDLLTGWHPDSIDLATHLTVQGRVCATLLLFWAATAAFRPAVSYHRLCVALMLVMAASILMLISGRAAEALELASAVFALNPYLHIYGLIAARSDKSSQRIVLLISFSIVAVLSSVRFIAAYGLLKLELLEQLPMSFVDLRLNGLPISIGFFTILLLERASRKVQREAELLRLRSQAAEAKGANEKLRDRQGFIDMLAHEIQNPLATMRFAISSLQRVSGAAGVASDAGRHLHSVDVSVKRISEFIQHVHALSRIEMMSPHPKAALTPAAELIEEVLSDYSDPGRFVVQVEHGVCFLADRRLLTVVFENLIGNAQKYSTPESAISIVVSRKGDRLSFAITNDVPPGRMPDQSRLFDRFYRHPEVLGISGSGLGLSVVRLAVERLDANIEVQVDGSRLCFTFEIPA